MSAFQFKKATKSQSKLRLGLVGPSGSGKTFTALQIATGLGGSIAVVDSERGSASKYADLFDFDVLELETFAPKTYVNAIKAAVQARYDVLIIVSLSHAWEGVEGALEQVDMAARRKRSGNRFTAWADVTPMHREMVDTILQSGLHVIVTMRVKTEWVLEENGKGKTVPRRVGLKPVQRDGMEYEFDVVGDIDLDHVVSISKSRCHSLTDKVFRQPGPELGELLRDWLSDGTAAPPPPPPFDQAAFEAQLPAGVTYEKVRAICSQLNKPQPERMTEEQRTGLLGWLAKPETLAKFGVEQSPAPAPPPAPTPTNGGSPADNIRQLRAAIEARRQEKGEQDFAVACAAAGVPTDKYFMQGVPKMEDLLRELGGEAAA